MSEEALKVQHKVMEWRELAQRLKNDAYDASRERRSYELLAAGYSSSLSTLLHRDEMADSNAAQEAWSSLEQTMRKVKDIRTNIENMIHQAKGYEHKADNPDTYLKGAQP